MKKEKNKKQFSLLYELFLNQSKKRPLAIAIKSSSKQLNYRELAILSKAVAHELIKQGTKPNRLVAIVMEKGWEQIVAALGILMSGSAYLPLDPAESKDRLDHLLEISEVNIILTQAKYLNKSDWSTNKTVIAIDVLSSKPNIQHENILLPHITSDNLAYVIFTSGSTGAPKGVMITHHSAMNTIQDINERFSVNFHDKIFALSNLTFDLSVYDIFGLLSVGGTIVLPALEEVKDPTRWHEIFVREKISIWNSVPALMNIFSEYLSHKNKGALNHKLRLILLSGDWIPLNLPEKIKSVFGKTQMISLGGATEASIWSILYPIHAIEPQWKSIPYGKPMKNQSFHILNSKLLPVKEEETGELYIGGEGVAAGYWHDPERTKAQFILHCLYGRLYKTGDLGRYLPDGNIEFLGRVDFQVKVAGYRVEVSAIEKYLLDFPWTKQAAVLVTKEKVHQKLIAYVTFDYEKLNQKMKNISIQKDYVSYWKKIYNSLSKNENDFNKNDPTFNTAGWVSSYLKKPIPNVQMQEWLNHTAKRILLLKPQNVLEIGCGTGLLLFRLVKQVKQYDATDLSKNAINQVNRHLKKLGILNTNLIECESIDIKNKVSGQYDTIILNSVVQYFPTIDYLVETLTECINKLNGKGQIFIGDLRSLHLLGAFHTSLFMNKLTDPISYAEWKSSISQSMEEEDELLIDFNFFYKLKESNPHISHVEIMLKEGKFQNEMNCFRYDVVLYIEHPAIEPEVQPVWFGWEKSYTPHVNLEKIHVALLNNASKILAIKNIPNKRTVGLAILPENQLAISENWVATYESCLIKARDEAVDPAVIYDIAKYHNYYALVTWSSTADPKEHFDVLFIHNDILNCLGKQYLCFLPQESRKFTSLPNSWNNYSNSPLLSYINRDLILEAKKFLRTRLPHYMIPSYFIPVQELPMTSNGKIDRNLLPKLRLSVITSKTHVTPKTSIQKRILLIWQKILGLQNISIHHSFYDLGGTSLLSMELITTLGHEFGVELTYQEFTACTLTIKNLGKLIERKTSAFANFN